MDWPGTFYADSMGHDFAEPSQELHAAIRDNEVTLLRRLLRSPPPSGTRALNNSYGGQHSWGAPLHVAVWCDRPEAVDLLLKAGAHAHVQTNDSTHATPWLLAARLGRREILHRFWPLIPLQELYQNDYNCAGTCLVQASCQGHTSTVEDMLD